MSVNFLVSLLKKNWHTVSSKKYKLYCNLTSYEPNIMQTTYPISVLSSHCLASINFVYLECAYIGDALAYEEYHESYLGEEQEQNV